MAVVPSLKDLCAEKIFDLVHEKPRIQFSGSTLGKMRTVQVTVDRLTDGTDISRFEENFRGVVGRIATDNAIAWRHQLESRVHYLGNDLFQSAPPDFGPSPLYAVIAHEILIRTRTPLMDWVPTQDQIELPSTFMIFRDHFLHPIIGGRRVLEAVYSCGEPYFVIRTRRELPYGPIEFAVLALSRSAAELLGAFA